MSGPSVSLFFLRPNPNPHRAAFAAFAAFPRPIYSLKTGSFPPFPPPSAVGLPCGICRRPCPAPQQRPPRLPARQPRQRTNRQRKEEKQLALAGTTCGGWSGGGGSLGGRRPNGLGLCQNPPEIWGKKKLGAKTTKASERRTFFCGLRRTTATAFKAIGEMGSLSKCHTSNITCIVRGGEEERGQLSLSLCFHTSLSDRMSREFLSKMGMDAAFAT